MPKPSPAAQGERPILYLKSGGPPADWRDYRVVRATTGKEIRDLTEANAFEGWVVQVRRGSDGNILVDRGGNALTVRLKVKIRIERKPPASARPKKEPKT